MSLLTTMVFLASLSYGMRLLEISIFVFVAIMSIALWVEMSYVGPDYSEMFKGWTVGFTETTNSDIFSLAGILGSVVMPIIYTSTPRPCKVRGITSNNLPIS